MLPLVSRHLQHAKKPLLVVLGPTASGKTAFAVALAKEIDGEIINADSRQLYKGMDIGTAKVTKEEMQGVPHHLIDQFDPDEVATAAWFKEKATACIEDILSRGKIPILVGGSMLYLSAVLDDLTFQKDGSEMRASQPHPTYDLLILGLGADRDETVVKINSRTEKLFAAGWIDEVRSLMEQGYTETDAGIKACGYREIMRYIKSGEEDIDALREAIAAKTRQYARRQMTWWKPDTRIVWL